MKIPYPRKTRMISLRLTEMQYRQLAALMTAAGYRSRTRFVTDTLLKRGPSLTKGTNTDRELGAIKGLLLKHYRGLARQGSNLNQLVAAANTLSRDKALTGAKQARFDRTVLSAHHVAEKLLSRSRDIHGIAIRVLCNYIGDEDEG